ncbi:hypothetical protein ABQ520_10030 [Bacillus velezensis]
MDIITGIGIALAGYFIGDGLKNFKSPDPHEHTDHILIKEKDLHFYIGYYLGVTKEEAKQIVPDTSDVPHITRNGKRYVQKTALKRMAEFHAEKRITAAMKSGKSFSLPVY